MASGVRWHACFSWALCGGGSRIFWHWVEALIQISAGFWGNTATRDWTLIFSWMLSDSVLASRWSRRIITPISSPLRTYKSMHMWQKTSGKPLAEQPELPSICAYCMSIKDCLLQEVSLKGGTENARVAVQQVSFAVQKYQMVLQFKMLTQKWY